MEITTIPTLHGLILDMDRASSRRAVLSIRSGDRASHILHVTLTSSGEKLILPDNSSVMLSARRADGTAILSPCTVNPDSTLSHLFTSSETEIAGNLECELYIVTPDAEITSPQFIVDVESVIRSESSVEASDEFSALGELIENAQNLNVEMEGKTLTFTDKNGDSSTLSFSEKENGKVTVTFTDKSSTVSAFQICDGSGGGGEEGTVMVRANSTGALTVAGTKIYLLDDSDNSSLEKTCEAIYAENAEYLVFVRHTGRLYHAQSDKYLNKLQLSFDFRDIAADNAFKKRVITWNPAGSPKITKTSVPLYASKNEWEDEAYYDSCAPTVKAVQEKLDEKQDAISDLDDIRSGAAAGASALQSVPSSYRTASAQDAIDAGKQNKIDSTHKLPYSLISDTPAIPSAVTEDTVGGWGFTKNSGTYSKPGTGIPKTDLASAVQSSLGKADTAYQKPSGGIPASDIAGTLETWTFTLSDNTAITKKVKVFQ